MPPSRRAMLERLERETFDLLVIGGGITGCGVARDAALRGLRVALVERDDIGSGTSSRSSRLVHGGIRYLEHGHLHLVFESSRERRTLMRIAPHLVRPLPFTWPVYRGARVPAWKLRAGLVLYDALSLFRNVRPHRWLDPRSVRAAEPSLAAADLEGGARYYDAATDDVRLTLATARSAADAGAVIVTRATATALYREMDRVTGAEVADNNGNDAGSLRVRARVVLNATGPWSDRLTPTANARSVRGTKGVHIAVERSRLPVRDAVTLLSAMDGRVMFVLPAGTHTIIGTTDTPTEEDPSEVRATESDVEYLLRSVAPYLPEVNLTRSDVVAAWAGIRPLAAAGYGSGPASASREHHIEDPGDGLITITGGKLTTYREMAAEIVDRVERRLGRARGKARTALLPLPGGDIPSLDATIAAARTRVGDAAWAARLALAYGSEWQQVAAIADDEALAAPIVEGLPYRLAEVVWAIENEWATTITDVLVRRTHVAFETRDHGIGAAARVASIMARMLSWSDAQRDEEIARYSRDVERIFAISR